MNRDDPAFGTVAARPGWFSANGKPRAWQSALRSVAASTSGPKGWTRAWTKPDRADGPAGQFTLTNDPMDFWRDAFSIRGAATLRVLPSILCFGVVAYLIYLVSTVWDVSLEVGPHEVAGALLGLLLVLRTNAGYDRWWEARKLWGGIVNQSRNLALAALSYGPGDPRWRDEIVRWTAAFPHVARASLRGSRRVPEIVALLGADEAGKVLASRHMPNYVAHRIGALLRQACRQHGMDRFGFLQADRERAVLIDHIGACERILKTPLARVYSIKIRRFIVLFLATLPFALLHEFQNGLIVPLATMLVAYPILALDQIGVELQNPFSTRSLSHLPLDTICRNIEEDLLAMLESEPSLEEAWGPVS
jgi:putative membrane protein